MTLIGELRTEARDEIEAAHSYRDLAVRLREAGHYSEGNLVDGIADDEDKHANILMTLANSIVSKQEPEELRLGERMVEYEIGKVPSRPFPQTYGDWVDLAEDVKEKVPDDLIMRSWVNRALQHISDDDELADEAKRYLMGKAHEIGIT